MFADSVGLNVPVRSVLQIFGRYEWLVRSRYPIPQLSTFVSPILPVTPADRELCGRLLQAYRQATASDEARPSAIWAEILSSHWKPLLAVLDGGDVDALARLLNEMFHHKFLTGISTTAVDVHKGRKARHAPFRLHEIGNFNLLSNLTSLAEFLGVERAESPEQGEIGLAFRDGLGALITRIEEKLGFSLDAPRAGSPVGLMCGHALITPETPEHIYCAARVCQILDAHLGAVPEPRIVEIGAGFGGTAHWFFKMRPDVSSYRIIDLPTTNVLQGYFLLKTLGTDVISLHGEPEKRVHIAPTHAIWEQHEPFDLLFNENSMPEIPTASVREYLCWAFKLCRLFYSYNHEAVTPATPQTLVPEVAREVGYELLTRSRSWVRRGYVEEIYKAGNRI